MLRSPATLFFGSSQCLLKKSVWIFGTLILTIFVISGVGLLYDFVNSHYASQISVKFHPSFHSDSSFSSDGKHDPITKRELDVSKPSNKESFYSNAFPSTVSNIDNHDKTIIRKDSFQGFFKET